MSAINFSASAPKAYILAVDGLFSTINPELDQVWSLNLGGADNHLLQIETTYGLQAKSMRLLPFLRINQQVISKSSPFSQPPQVTNYTPATVHLKFCLETGFEVNFDCFLPEQQVLMGAVEFRNPGAEQADVQFDLASVLVPMGEGLTTHPQKIGVNHILVGRTGEIWPVLFMSSAPKAISNPYPALSKGFRLHPGETQSLTWALVSMGSQETSFERARTWSAANWQKEAVNQVRQHDAHTIHIQTGDPDWDAAFSLAQTIALTHLGRGDPSSKSPIFIKTRLPDHSAPKLDNRDLTVLEASQLAQIFLPSQVDLMSTLLETLLERVNQETTSSPADNPFLPNPSFNTCPMIAHLCGECLKIKPNEEKLQRIYPQLVRFFETRIPQKIDQLAHDFPVFESPNQLQLHTGDYQFDIWHRYGGGLDIQKVISPALAAMLYHEFGVLQKMAYQTNDRKTARHYGALRKSARSQILACWQDETQLFAYQDHRSHQTSLREWVSSGNIQRSVPINRTFSTPQRLQCHLFSEDENPKACVLNFEGTSETGKLLMEEIKIPGYRWVMGHAHITTNFLFKELHTVIIEGLAPNDRYVLENVDHSQPDITCLLPMWSGGASDKTYGSLIQSLQEKLTQAWKKGIPETWEGSNSLPEGMAVSVNVLWNTLIIEGMLRQGFQDEAVTAFTNLMGTIINGLRGFEGFYPTYDCQTGGPTGLKNAVTGLPPMRLFLELAGIKLFTPNRLAIWGTNPFPWPIRIQWQGLNLEKEETNTRVIFPNGAEYHHQSSKPVLLTPKSS